MHEHLFPSGAWAVDDARATVLVAEITEAIADMISRPDHDWTALDRQAGGIRAVTSLMVERYRDGHG